MRTIALACLLVAMLMPSCAVERMQVLPEFASSTDTAEARAACAACFPKGRWQFVHALGFDMAGGFSGNALGVVALNGDDIKVVLMTVEGLNLFEAGSASRDNLEVSRAVPPFDKPGFAQGLMRDVRSIFQRPAGALATGTLPGDLPACRYEGEGEISDLVVQTDGCWRLETYQPQVAALSEDETVPPPARPVLTRRITTASCQAAGKTIIPQILELTAPGPEGYSLTMRLISAERLANIP